MHPAFPPVACSPCHWPSLGAHRLPWTSQRGGARPVLLPPASTPACLFVTRLQSLGGITVSNDIKPQGLGWAFQDPCPALPGQGEPHGHICVVSSTVVTCVLSAWPLTCCRRRHVVTSVHQCPSLFMRIRTRLSSQGRVRIERVRV